MSLCWVAQVDGEVRNGRGKAKDSADGSLVNDEAFGDFVPRSLWPFIMKIIIFPAFVFGRERRSQ